MGLTDRILRPTGLVVAELRYPDGALFERYERPNAYTDAAATLHAMLIAQTANPPSLGLTHIGLGIDGYRITQCESASGWTGSPSVDATNYREGAACLYKAVTASTNATIYHATVSASRDLSLAGSGVKVALKLDYRARCILANSQLRVYTGGSASNYYVASFVTLESVAGSSFQDGTWKEITVPTGSFSSGGGSPNWNAVTGVGLYIEANAVGTLTVSIDDVQAVYSGADVTKTATIIPYEGTRKAMASLTRAGMVVVASGAWGENEAVGSWTMAGLYCNVGASLFAVTPLAYYKPKALTLTVNWTITTRGG